MVEATISYLEAMSERPFFLLYDPPPGTPWRNTKGDRHPVAIGDARRLDPPPSLDEEGIRAGAPRDGGRGPLGREGREDGLLPRARGAGAGPDRRSARRRLRPQPPLRDAG